MRCYEGAKIERLLSIMLLLSHKRKMNAPELARLLEVSVRTIHRDVEALIFAGVPLSTTRGVNGGIELEERYKLESNLFSGRDLASIAAALATTQSTGCFAGIEHVTAKVESLVPEEEREEFRSVTDRIFIDLSPWNDSESRRERILSLEEAISSCKVLKIEYLDAQNRVTSRDIEPHTLALKGPSWYLYAFCRLRQDFRVFRVSRIRGFEATSEHFAKREVDYTCLPWNEAWSTENDGMRVKLLLDELGRAKAGECFPEELILPHEDARYVLEMELPDHEWVPRYILSFGDHIEVLEPSVLREKVAELARRICGKYLDRTTGDSHESL